VLSLNSFDFFGRLEQPIDLLEQDFLRPVEFKNVISITDFCFCRVPGLCRVPDCIVVGVLWASRAAHNFCIYHLAANPGALVGEGLAIGMASKCD
jgi:hypothetical protein